MQPLGEPFANLLTQGMVVAPTFYREDETARRVDQPGRRRCSPATSAAAPVGATLRADGQPVVIGGTEKMSKSKNNGVDPQALIDQYGADTARLFIMFASPPDQSLEWSDAGVEGAYRFLKRVWRIVFEHVSGGSSPPFSVANCRRAETFRRQLHQTIGKVADDYGRRKQFNTAIAAVMELLNAYAKLGDDSAMRACRPAGGARSRALMLYPIVPHVCEALYAELKPGQRRHAAFPEGRCRAALVQDEIELMLQVNGKLRGSLRVPAGADKARSKPPRWPAKRRKSTSKARRRRS
jgi:leucyl-tRNA synthetase